MQDPGTELWGRPQGRTYIPSPPSIAFTNQVATLRKSRSSLAKAPVNPFFSERTYLSCTTSAHSPSSRQYGEKFVRSPGVGQLGLC